VVSKCANPTCETRFDFYQGQLFRFRKQQVETGSYAKSHSVPHFWLCGDCCKKYALVYEEEKDVLIRNCSREPAYLKMACVIAAA
jgi:hypothetical protein